MTLIGKQNDGEVPKGGHLIQGKDGSGNAQDVAVDTDGNLQVDIVSGGSSGTQYTEGDTDTTFTGTVAIAEGPSNTATPLQVDASKHLQVDIAADSVGIGGGVQYDESDTDASITGTAILMEAAADTLVPVQGTVADGLLVNLGSNNDISGTVTANAGTNLNTSALALESGGNLAAIATDAAAIETLLTTIEGNQLADGHNVTVDNGAGASAVNIQDGGNTITVDGTVTANLSAVDNAVLDDIAGDTESIKTAVEILDNAISGSEMQVDIVSSAEIEVTLNGETVDTELTTADLDTGAGTDTRAVIGLVGSASGGGQLIPGSSTDGLLVNLGANNDVTVSGVSTAANQTTIIGHLDGVEGLLTTIDTDTGSIATNAATLAGAVSGTEMQVDVLTMPTTTVQATNLDIRDIDAASDDITIHGDVGIVDQMDLTNSNPLAVAIVNGDGDQITSFGGGTQYTEGDTDASITGTAMLMEVAADALEPVQGTVADGLLVNLGSNNDVTVSGVSTAAKQDTIIGHLDGVEGILTTIDTDTGNIATAVQLIDDAIHADDAAFTLGTSKGVMMMGFAGTQSVNANDAGAIAMETDGSVHIHDGGNTITVDGTVTANLSATDNQVLDNIDADLTTVIGHVDGIEALLGTIDTDTGNIDTSLNTIEAGYAAEGAALGSGVLIQGDDGTDRTNVLVDTDGHLQVDVLSGGVAGTEYTVDADAPDTPAGGTFVMERDDTLAALTPIEGDWVHPRSNANGALWTAVNGTVAVTQSGTWDEVGINDSGNSITVDNGGTFAVQVDGSALTALQLIDNLVLAEDAAHISGDPGIQMLGVSNESLTSWASSSTGDYTPIATDRRGIPLIMGPVNHDVVESGIVRPIVTGSVAANSEPAAVAAGDVVRAYFDTTGYQYVKLGAGTNGIGKLTANSGVDIGDVDVTSITGVTMSNAAIQTTGDEAHDDADAGNPVKIGGKAQSHLSDPAEVSAANDRVNALFDRVGRQAVYSGYPIKSAVINTSTSGDNTIVAAVATKHIRVLSVLIVSDGTTDVRWESGAGGTALTGQVPLQAREGYAISNSWGLFQTTAVNTLLNLELTAAVNVHGFITYIEVDD